MHKVIRELIIPHWEAIAWSCLMCDRCIYNKLASSITWIFDIYSRNLFQWIWLSIMIPRAFDKSLSLSFRTLQWICWKWFGFYLAFKRKNNEKYMWIVIIFYLIDNLRNRSYKALTGNYPITLTILTTKFSNFEQGLFRAAGEKHHTSEECHSWQLLDFPQKKYSLKGRFLTVKIL